MSRSAKVVLGIALALVVALAVFGAYLVVAGLDGWQSGTPRGGSGVGAQEVQAFAGKMFTAVGSATPSTVATTVAAMDKLVDYKALAGSVVEELVAGAGRPEPAAITALRQEWPGWASGRTSSDFLDLAFTGPSAGATGTPASVRDALLETEHLTYPLLSLGVDDATRAAAKAAGSNPQVPTVAPLPSGGVRISMTVLDPGTGKGTVETVDYFFSRTASGGLRLIGCVPQDAAKMEADYVRDYAAGTASR